MSCRAEVVDYIFDSGIIHGNPILIELADTGDNGNRSDAIRVWRRRANQTSTFYEFFVRRVSPESEIPVDNSLDILDGL
jgi:hypothetical protein